MPNSLAQLTDAYEPEIYTGLPVANPYRRIPVYKSEDIVPENKVEGPSTLSQNVDKILNALFRDDEKRLQLWPEKVLREGLSAAHDAVTGELPQWAIDPKTGDVHTSPQMVEKAQSMAALAGTGGLGGVTDATLGATPFLRPALKYKDRLYKGKEGQQHMDVIPEALYPEFQRMAMSGEDISHYNFGFVNDKGHFLDREKALRYAIDTGMVDKFAGQYGALTSTLLADSSKPGMAIEAMGKSKAPTFYSAVEHNLNKIPQTKMTGDQWLGTLVNKPGVKPEELDWTGLRQYLQDNNGKAVSKEQIQEHLASNKVELVEKNSHTPNPKLNEMLELDAKARRYEADGEVDAARAIREQIKAIPKTGDFNPRYKDYQLPGGENYREMLLTLPNKEQRQYGFEWFDPATQKSRAYATEAEAKANAPAGAVISKAEIGPTLNPAYKSSHWDEPNILAHVRMNDRDIGGKKSLHLEEIQSDWHQQGRDRGYRPDNEKKMADLVAHRDDLLKEASSLSPNDARYKEIYKELPTTQSEINRLGGSDVGVPDAPFKKTWHELALKRMIREAAEKGYDRLSWTPGEAQAARYDLSKQLKELQYLKNEDGTYSIAGVTKDGGGFNHPDNVPASKLPDIVGKEMAEKIVKNEGKRARGHPANGGYFEGVDLKVGGEGMKGFYDQIIPKSLEKIGKEHGVKVQKGNINTNLDRYSVKNIDGKYHVVDKDGNSIWIYHTETAAANKAKSMSAGTKSTNDVIYYIDIPQSLRDTALHKGFPLFSGKYMFAPVDYEPEFKK